MPESPPPNLPEILASHALWDARDPSGQRANLRDANLRGANLRDAYLRGADLRDANLRDADLRDANLRGADLRDANLRDADLFSANLRGANLVGADMRDADLRCADMRGVDLFSANLVGADMRGADLRDANLRGANLRGVDLFSANLVGADMRDATGIVIAPDAPLRLRAAAAAALQDGALEMQTWHSCHTTHCLGGWLIHQAGEVGRLLEAAVGPSLAGLMLGGVEAHSHFHDTNEAATEYLRSVLAQEVPQ